MIRRVVTVTAKHISRKDYDGIVAVTKLIPLVNFKTPPVASRSSEASVIHNPVVTAQTKLPKATNHSRNTPAASRLSSSYRHKYITPWWM